MDVGQAVLPTIQTEKCRLRIQVYNGCPLSLLAVANSPNRLTIVALLAPLTECEHQRCQYVPRFCCVPLGRCWSLLTKKFVYLPPWRYWTWGAFVLHSHRDNYRLTLFSLYAWRHCHNTKKLGYQGISGFFNNSQ